MPALGCLILARPTKQMGLYRQMIGRGLRPAPDKTNCIVIDHSGVTYRLGFAEDHVEWTLDPDRKAENPTMPPAMATSLAGQRSSNAGSVAPLASAGWPVSAAAICRRHRHAPLK